MLSSYLSHLWLNSVWMGLTTLYRSHTDCAFSTPWGAFHSFDLNKRLIENIFRVENSFKKHIFGAVFHYLLELFFDFYNYVMTRANLCKQEQEVSHWYVNFTTVFLCTIYMKSILYMYTLNGFDIHFMCS